MAMLETWPASSAGPTLFVIFPKIQLTQFHNGLELRILLGAGLTVTKKVCLLLYYTTAAAAQLQRLLAQWDPDWKINPKLWLFLDGSADSPTTSCLKVPHFIIKNLKSVHFKNRVARSSVLSKLWSFSIIHLLTLFRFQQMYYILKMIELRIAQLCS